MKIKSYFILLISILLISTAIFSVRVPVAYGICKWSLARVVGVLEKVIRNGGGAEEIGRVIRQIQTYATVCDEGGNAISGTPIQIDLSPYPTPGPGTTYPTRPPGQSDGTWPFFCQLHDRVQDAYFTDLGWSIRDNGCGPTSMASILCALRKYDDSSKWDNCVLPADMARAFTTQGYYGLTAYYPALEGVEASFPGVKHEDASRSDLAQWQRFLDAGALMWVGTRQIPCGVDCNNPNIPLAGHVVAVDKVDVANGTFRVRNPNDCLRSGDGLEYTPGGQWWRLGDFTIFIAFAIKM